MECTEDEERSSGEVCWKEECYVDASENSSCEEVRGQCKIWHAYEYDYELNSWKWDIEEC